MLGKLKKLFDPNEKELRRLRDMVAVINSHEPAIQALSDEDLRGKTAEFRQRLAQGATLDDLLPEAFAVVREAARRTLGERHYDVQLMGGIVLHEGRIAEMKTGEGKTLVATLPAYLNALAGRGVHVVTVNDYLAKRDAEWMGSVYRFLGLTVGVILHGKNFRERREAYACDVTYGTNNEFGFDYLRDNMVLFEDQMVQRPLYYAIVDEVDSILIDEARTPLIISGMAEESTDHYYKFAQLVRQLKPNEDYTVDEKARTVAITEEGVAKVERMLGVDNLYDDTNFRLTHYLQQALRAHTLFQRDRDYVVKDGQVIIVDEFTGRMMPGRRYSDGLHQAIEAKEGVKIERESQTLASITFQNYFRMYEKLAGMTGTAKTEEEEFRSIYGMDVVVIPTHRPMIRIDYPDVVYKTEQAKFNAVVEEIAQLHAQGRPVLVGTVSIEKSERLSAMLKRRGIPHQVLNAKYHEKEAEIIAQAGKPGAVTIATNMAGRGTDILLGGNPEFLAKQRLRRLGFTPEEIQVASEKRVNLEGLSERELEARRAYEKALAEARAEVEPDHRKVVELGGLHIIGTERHEARRIDNQLRGRAGRQGDPGSSRFYLSLEDDLMRLFGSERIAGLVERLGWPDDEPLEHNQLTKAIENAQRRVESRNFEIRKQVLQYDDVLNKQREVIYAQRRKVLRGENLKESVLEMLEKTVDEALDTYCNEKVYPEEWDVDALAERILDLLNRREHVDAAELRSMVDIKDAAGSRGRIREALLGAARRAYDAREAEWGPELMRAVERHTLLTTIDSKWMAHLRDMDDLREGIGLRAYGQRQPLLDYQIEGFEMFQNMIKAIREDVVSSLFRIRVVTEGERDGRRPLGAGRRDLLRSATTNEAAIEGLSGGSVRGAAAAAGGAAAGGMGMAAASAARRPGAGGAAAATVVQRRVTQRVGRNDPCPCGSGKKYKRCCGAGT